MSTRGHCPKCRRRIGLRPNGAIYRHLNHDGILCSGSGHIYNMVEDLKQLQEMQQELAERLATHDFRQAFGMQNREAS